MTKTRPLSKYTMLMLAFACIVGGVAVLGEWIMAPDAVKVARTASTVSMKPVTVYAALVVAVAQALLVLGKEGAARCLAYSIPVWLSFLMLVGYVTGAALPTSMANLAAAGAGIPSIPTYVCMVLLAVSVLRRGWVCIYIVRAVAFVALLGHALHIPAMYGLWPGISTAMAVPTAVYLFILAFVHA